MCERGVRAIVPIDVAAARMLGRIDNELEAEGVRLASVKLRNRPASSSTTILPHTLDCERVCVDRENSHQYRSDPPRREAHAMSIQRTDHEHGQGRDTEREVVAALGVEE